ncbi:phage minor capsid protein [Cohnella abietis]|uniref:Minor capsid protein n=1 Tax=Cohnella abietis TaxID=2507935 RepID=A0A3T1D2V6_9BACL|nr:phage minor capsid protein [Cohnella abietis]BBI32359.1 hypothetical protein KCTCHS21_17580 [Cohnella abietis]
MSAYDVKQIFIDMEQDLINNMRRNLARHEAEEAELGFNWEQWQQRKIESLQRYRKENRLIINRHGTQVDAETGELLKGSFLGGAQKADAKLYKASYIQRIASKLTEPITRVDGTDSTFFQINDRRLNALVTAVTQDLQRGRFAMLRQADDVYRKTIFRSQMYYNSGAVTVTKAIDMATRDFLDRGFNCITYSDGRTVDIAAYSEMVLRTSAMQASFAGEGARRSEWGINTVVVSTHGNCSDRCMPWQGRVYIDDVYGSDNGNGGDYPLLSTAVGGGLFGPNCRHNSGTYIPGVSSEPEQVDEGKAEDLYDAEQKQRYMERQIRQYKRREIGSVDPDNQAAAADKVKQWKGKLTNHLDEYPDLRRDRSRERIGNRYVPPVAN